MKKVSIIAAILSLVAAVSCTNGVKYSVSGPCAKDGAKVSLIDQITKSTIDSTVVADGTFSMTGKADKDALLAVKIEGTPWMFQFFNDGTPVTLDPEQKTVTGSELNNKLTEYDLKSEELHEEFYAFRKSLNGLSDEEIAAKMPEYRAKLQAITDFFDQLFEENKDNIIPAAFIRTYQSLKGNDKFTELFESGAAYAAHPFALNVKQKADEAAAKRKEAEEKKQAIIDQQFLDLEEPDVDGNMHKLSEYVGKGKWVLVDFWASWCGPCKKEMPNVVEAYKKFHDKGFEVVGLSFDNKKEPWVKAITEWEMPWIHLSDLKGWDSAPHDVYTVNSIPDNLLIDPEGKVVARCLRGEALAAKLQEIFQ